ncbi:MAG: acetyl-CoA decarbonylase/synthase complex subunit gamma [Nitrospirota bacterium]|nr:acetyl-CoA decarbonylase/synthase complex subunit gamma [Nitrospirota bacterium]
MALSGVEIFKLLPKTNCKECGVPTCLAFAMKLAAKQASLDQCPYASDEAKKVLGAAAEPPIRVVTIGTGDNAVKMGDEVVLFRHDKKFFNPTAIALAVNDDDANIDAKVAAVKNSVIERVGQFLRVNAITVIDKSGDAAKFAAVVAKVVAADIPVILHTKNAAVAEAGVKSAAGKKPMIYAADESNAEAMAGVAKAGGASLAITAKGLDALTALSEKVKGLGVDDIVLDSGARTAKEMIHDYTMIRRAAAKKNFKPLGYPVIGFACRDNAQAETAITAVGIMKYASLVVVNSIEKWQNIALFTLRQNIFTDPQVPMQVEEKIYKIGEPDANSPLMITTNFSLTYFIVAGEVENSKVPCWLAIMNNEGLSVLTAWAAGKFTAGNIAKFINEIGADKVVGHKELIIPGYVSVLSGSLEDKLGGGWKVVVGPREANQLPAFLKQKVAA